MSATTIARRVFGAVCALALILPGLAWAALGPANELGQFRYLIEFSDPGALHAVEREPGARFDPAAAEIQAHLAQLQSRHDAFIAELGTRFTRIPEVSHRFLVTHSGMAVWLAPAEAESLLGHPDVVSVERERIETIDTYRGPTFIGADLIWDGSAVPGGAATQGEGVVVAILDTGIDPDHPSFANAPMCGHGTDGNPEKLISFVDCATTDAQGRCNGLAPFDTNGHGSHVASTAAGNFVDGSASPPPEPFAAISGVAPCASIRSYKVCPDLSCPAGLIQAGMNSVLLDGDVDVMNFSISGGRNPWNDNDRRKLDLVGAGIVVAASAGNTGPTLENPVGAVNHLGPWVFTIAASTHDGGDVEVPHLSASGPGVPPGNTQLLVLTEASADPDDPPAADPFTDMPIRRGVDDLLQIDDEACAPFTPGYFEGAVALVKRGTCPFAAKVQNAQAAGAEVVVIRNDVPEALTAFTVGVTPLVPVYGMSGTDGDALAAFIGEHPQSATANLEFIAGTADGDVLAGFSLRGPTPAPLQHLHKPDITAPGVAIFAAEPTLFGVASGYGFKSGTSMSGPHAAGAAALVRAVHPDWTPAEVKSALMMTAFQGGTKSDEVTPWDADDVGSGRVDLTRAALAGLVMDEVFENFLAAEPAAGGDVRTLNLAALRNVDCTPDCSWTRVVRNTLGVPAQWVAEGVSDDITITVSPSSFAFSGDPGETQALTITATPKDDQAAAVAFGELVLRESGGLSPDQHLTVAVRGVGGGGGVEPPPPTESEIDDADPAIEYRRGWHRKDHADATAGGYHRRMGASGGEPATARLVFEGDRITYLFGTSQQGGSADVFIDGEFMATIDFSGAAPGSAPAFGHSRSFDGLGEGTHEFLLVHRGGAAYVDGFVIGSGGGSAGADASAAETRSVTTRATGQLSGLGTSLVSHAVEVSSADEWLSVLVESPDRAVDAVLIDPLGVVVANASVLLAGSNVAGIDMVPMLPGTYTVQALDALGQPATVSISVSRTIAVD